MNPELVEVLQLVDSSMRQEESAIDLEHVVSTVARAESDELEWLLDELCERDELASEVPATTVQVVDHLLFGLVRGTVDRQPGSEFERTLDRERIVRLYKHLRNSSAARAYLLSVLAGQSGADDLRRFSDLVVEDPPVDPNHVAVAFSPLFQSKDYDPAPLFPRLLDGLHHVSAAVATMDLANYLTREQRVEVHPARDHVANINSLLEALTAQLARLEQLPSHEQSAAEMSQKVEDCIALVISLCDATSLIGDSTSMSKLRATMELHHRRLRTEAAAALASFGDDEGKAVLVAMAAEPVTRLRVIAYADELGIGDRIDPRFRRPESLAAAELSLYLAQPTQVGIPPTEVELIDQRELFWPGFDSLVDCRLLRYIYRAGDRQVSNIGIVGPVTHAVAADLQDLPIDDIYACFAGWHAQHEDIYEIDVPLLTEAQGVDVSKLQRRAHDRGYSDIRPLRLCRFFGQKVLVAKAVVEGAEGIIVVDDQDLLWFSSVASSRPLGPVEAYNIYKGRHLLRTFNE